MRKPKDSLSLLKNPLVKQFILGNEADDVQKLLLNPPLEFRENINLIVDQIISRRKAKTKLPEWYANTDIILPPPLSLEQSSSPATAKYKSQLLNGKTFTDLTGGMGIDTLEFSIYFETVNYVELNPELCDIFRHNAQVLGQSKISVHNTTAEHFLESFNGRGYFFIDPARRGAHKSRVFLFEDCMPNILEILPVLKEKSHQVLVKAAPMIDISLGIKQLQFVQEVHVVSVKNEVKEVLFLLDFDKEIVDPEIHCVNLESVHPKFNFTITQEQAATCNFGEVSTYLYDPNSSILKAGAFKSVGSTFSLNKLAINTHLYTSDQLISNFPGRIFEVMAANVTKKNLARLLPEGKANIITKNYPQKPEEVKKKLKIKDGGEYFLIGFRDSSNKPQTLITLRVK